MRRKRIIVGITGATGIDYGVCLLKTLRALDIETHLVVSRPAELTRAYESTFGRQALQELADTFHRIGDIGASIASGSFPTEGMLVAPCSAHTLAEIANGTTSNLLTRAADVVLKERRRLVLLVRETPLSLVHIRNMMAVTEAGGIIMPPVPAFYTKPRSIEELIYHTVGRSLELFGLNVPDMRRWAGTPNLVAQEI